MEVITRIPPSPTGKLNIGTARSALFNYLFAKKNNGKLILRFEDTDKERSKKEFEENIIESLEWLGIKWDNTEIFRQSEMTDIYKKYIEKLIEANKAYISEETEGKNKEVIRFKNPNKVIKFNDELRGEISFDTTDLGDFIIARSIDDPLYHLTVVVDDHEMNISHVIRGEDGISNTPRQILIQEAIGAKRPIYTHLPLVLGSDKKKLSKRHGAKSILEFKEEGYLKESIINQLVLLGWNPGTDQEIFSLKELEETFSLEGVQKGGAVFDAEKLNWFNQHYLKEIPKEEQNKIIKEKLEELNINLSEEKIEKINPIITERISTFNEIYILVKEGELDWLIKESVDYPVEDLKWKKAEKLEDMIPYLEFVHKSISENNLKVFSEDKIKELIWDYASEKGRGDVLWPLRYSLSGKEKSPDPFKLAEVLGKEKTLERIEIAINKIKSNEN